MAATPLPIDIEEYLWIPKAVTNTYGWEEGTRMFDSDDYGEAMMALVRAVKGYNPSRGNSFTTYAYSSCKRAILNFHHKMMISKRRKPRTRHIDYAYASDEDFDLIDNRSMAWERDLICHDLLEAYKAKIHNEASEVVLDMTLEGYTAREIGEKLGVSASAVNLRKLTAFKKIRRLGGEPYDETSRKKEKAKS